MIDDDESAGIPPAGPLHKLHRVWQWVLGIFTGLLALMTVFAALETIGAPGAPVTYFWISIAVWTVAALTALPSVYFRLPKFGRMASYAGLVVGFFLTVFAFSDVQTAYERTPAGKIEVAKREKEEAAAAIAAQKKRETEQKFAEAEAAGEQLREIERQQQACLSWGGEVRALSEAVQAGLHDPSSFEHVQTRFIVPAEDRLNVLMTFRAANGFGAVRTANIRAQMIPSTCEIVKVGEIEAL